jgi:hypothetical protein
MNQIQRKKALIVFLCVELFWFASFLIHEAIHGLSFLVLSGRFGEIHIMDSIAYSYHTVAVTLPPQGLVIFDTTPFELIAYGLQFGITILFAILLFKKYYSSPDTDERITKSPSIPAR